MHSRHERRVCIRSDRIAEKREGLTDIVVENDGVSKTQGKLSSSFLLDVDEK